jgi:antitoxin VapB
MSLNIKKPETHALAERVAALAGETLTDAVTTALRERLARLERDVDVDPSIYRRLREIAAGCRSRMKEPYLSIDHGDLLYDDQGLPK